MGAVRVQGAAVMGGGGCLEGALRASVPAGRHGFLPGLLGALWRRASSACCWHAS